MYNLAKIESNPETHASSGRGGAFEQAEKLLENS